MDDLCDDISEIHEHEPERNQANSAPEHGSQKPSREELLTVLEVAAELKLDRRTIYRYLKTGQFRGIRFAGTWRVRRRDLTAFLEARRYNIT